MKMRKKLAALLAAAMIASVMPMTAFAASTNHVTQTVRVADKGATDKPVVQITMKDKLVAGETFYLKLENAEWDTAKTITTEASINSLVDTAAFEIEASKTELAITAKKDFDKDDYMRINLVTKEIKGEAKVIVDPWDTVVTKSEHVFAIAATAKASVTVKEDDAPSFYTGTNAIAKFVIEEGAIGELANNPKLTFTLDNDEFEFVTGTAKYSKGFATTTGQPTFTVVHKDEQVIEVDFTNVKTALTGRPGRGVVELELKVKATTRKPATGDLKAEISGKLVDTKEYKVAKIAEYGFELKADKTDYAFLAGRQKEVVFHLNEIVDDSLVNGREIEFSLPEGVYFKNGGVTLKDGTGSTISYERNKDDQVEKISLTLNANNNKVDKFKFEAKLDITSDFEGDIVLKAEGRAIGEDLEATIAKVTPPVKVTVEPMTVKPGLKEQVGGKIVIEELEKGALLKDEIVISLEKESGLYVTDADVEVTKGDLKKGDITVSKTTQGAITIAVKRQSREASTIELTNVKVKLDRTVPEGAYEISVGGPAISELTKEKYANELIYKNDAITAKDFLYVGERYTRPVTVFTIGTNVYTLNGETFTMDAAAYIKDGRTMVPVRYLAYALGINPDSIKFNAGIVTIFAEDGKVIQLKNGDKNLVINGMSIPMVASATIVEGRTYVPVTEIGGVFGVTGTWDAEAQTATFK